MSDERTPLTSNPPPGPAYVFPGVSRRTRRRQIRQFQCCICAIFLTLLLLAIAITVSYTLTDDQPDTTLVIDTTPNDTESILNATQLFTLLVQTDQPIADESPTKWAIPDVSDTDKKQAESEGIKALGDREIMEETMNSPEINTPSFKHQRAIGTTAEGRKLSKRGYAEDHATTTIAKKYNYTKTAGRSNIGQGPSIGMSTVHEKVNCAFNRRYRMPNGTCNNLRHSEGFGRAYIPFRRALAPDYADGISKPRESHSGHVLPTARVVSTTVHRPAYSVDPHFSVMFAVWGQFLDHDITATAGSQGPDGEPIECCEATAQQHPECFPVTLGPGDPYYDQYKVSCMNFVRSAPAPTGKFGPREQLNQATAFIDASVVYGNTDDLQMILREEENGLLRMFVTPDNRTLLPISTNPKDGCNEVEMNSKGRYCFESGDPRSNENLHLTSMHLIFARHHNFLAQNLQEANPDWSDETVFQEARKIIGAQMQHITYNEFLPVLFGKDFLLKKQLLPQSVVDDEGSLRDTYNSSMDPSIANIFAGSAFRFAHTLIPGLMKWAQENQNAPESVELHKMLFNPFSLWSPGGVDNAIESAVITPLGKVDQYFSTELTEKLFQPDNLTMGSRINKQPKLCGLDLVSLNIQRGRDHGLPAYYEWRKHCNLPATDTWDKMANAVDPDSLESMKKIYGSAMDVDFYTGALSEPPVNGSIVGPLLACLISDQFIRIKFGDSHWYERTRGPQKFTPEQLNEIYKTSLAGVICQNSDNIHTARTRVMEASNNSTNPLFDCTKLESFNFTHWKQTDSHPSRIKMASKGSQVLIMQGPTIAHENSTLTSIDSITSSTSTSSSTTELTSQSPKDNV